MNDEIDDEILDSELADDALDKKMKKLESEAARLLDHSTELIKAMSQRKEKQEEEKPVDSE